MTFVRHYAINQLRLACDVDRDRAARLADLRGTQDHCMILTGDQLAWLHRVTGELLAAHAERRGDETHPMPAAHAEAGHDAVRVELEIGRPLPIDAERVRHAVTEAVRAVAGIGKWPPTRALCDGVADRVVRVLFGGGQ
jgi:hypothetical protein